MLWVNKYKCKFCQNKQNYLKSFFLNVSKFFVFGEKFLCGNKCYIYLIVVFVVFMFKLLRVICESNMVSMLNLNLVRKSECGVSDRIK